MYSDPTIQLISLALDASLMRQTAIANNIAHANSNNYKSIGVNFEQQLHDYEIVPGDLNQETLAQIQPLYEQSDSSTPVSIAEQMALGVKNTTHYRALIKGLNHHVALMKLALQGTKQS